MAEFGEISALYQKFGLLISNGFYSDWKTLGDEFNVEGKTVQSWGHGSAKQRANWVPERHQAKLIPVFAKAFAHKDYSPSKIRSLILAPLPDFERELQLSKSRTLTELIEREGRSNGCDLYTPTAKLHLVSRSNAHKRQPDFSISLATEFRLEFRTGFGGAHTHALQHVEKLWAPVDTSFDAAAGIIHVPGFVDEGKLDFMVEKDHPGLHRFVVLQTRAAFPLSVQTAFRQSSVLDSRTLDELAGFYADLKETERRIFYVDVAIVEREKNATATGNGAET